MTPSAAELEPQIEQSRDVLARDVDALRRKAAPRQMMREAMDRATARGRQAGADLLEKAKVHPVSAAVLGVALAGAAWLWVRRRR